MAEDSRSDYYNKWDKFTKDEVAKAEEEEEQAKLTSNEKLGIDKGPRSEAEAKDLAKREALKAAKKQWDEREKKELAQRAEITDHKGGETVELNSTTLENKPVVLLKNNDDTTFILPENMNHRIIKLFVEACKGCRLIVNSDIITQHIELSHCDDCVVEVHAPTATVQADLCDGLTVIYAENLLQKNHKVYHAGVKNLLVETKCGHKTTADYVTDLEGHVMEQGKVLEEQQFVTHFVDGKLISEKVFRAKSNMPITKREADKSSVVDDVQSRTRTAELKKLGGNEAFSEGNYAQAAIFYTEAIDVCHEMDEPIDVLHTSLSNRAACFLKLGHHEKALADAEECIKLQPEFVKGHFRRGVALHAMKRYHEAARTLSQALDMEPKNKQIKQALTFAEAKIRQEMQKRQ